MDGIVDRNTSERLIVTVRQGDSNNRLRAMQDQLRSGSSCGSVAVAGAFGSGTGAAGSQASGGCQG